MFSAPPLPSGNSRAATPPEDRRATRGKIWDMAGEWLIKTAAMLAEEIRNTVFRRFKIRPFVTIARVDYEN